jgi:hypothetical protein
MKVYVQSRGFAQEHDYSWVDENRHIVEEPGLVKEFQHLIQREAESLLLARDKANNQLLLLLTGIKSEKRKDFQNRPINISVAWISECSKDNEKKISSLAISFLERTLISKIDWAIDEEVYQEGKNYGFKVSFDSFIQLANNYSNSETKGVLTKIIKNISEDEKKHLIEELKTKNLPPEQYGTLVVVTGIKSKSTLEQAKVWRGLAKLIDDSSNVNNNHQIDINNAKKNFSNYRIFIPKLVQYILYILLVVSLMLNIYLYREITKNNQNNQNNQKIEKIKIELQDEKNKNDSIIKELQSNNEKIDKSLQKLNALFPSYL